MLKGRYGDTSGRPYLEGRLFLARLGLQGDISFLVDTGADRTVLMVDDAQLMGVDYSELKLGKQKSVGIGGMARHFAERAVAVLPTPAISCMRTKSSSPSHNSTSDSNVSRRY